MLRGTRIAKAVVDVSVSGDGMNEDIVRNVDDAGPGVEKAGDEHGKRYGDRFSEGFFRRMKEKFGPRISQDLGADVDREGSKIGDRLGSALVQKLRARLTEQHGLMASLTEEFNKASIDDGTDNAGLAKLSRGLTRAKNDASLLEKELRRVMEAEGLIKKIIPGGSSGVSGNNDPTRRFGDRLASLLGGDSTSRNNALVTLRLFAKGLGGIVNIMQAVGTGAFDMFKNFQTGFTSAEEGASFLQKMMAGLSDSFSGLASSAAGAGGGGGAGLIGLAVMIPLVAAAAAILVSVLGALAGIVTALASGLVGGLTAGLLVAGAGFASLAVAGGALMVMFKSMTDAQKRYVTEVFRPLHEEMVGLGQDMLRKVVPAMQTWSINLQNALMLSEPLVRRLGGAFAQAGDTLTRSFSGPGFQLFFQSLATFLPGIVRNLAAALGSFLNGLLGVFTTIMPYVSQFARYLSDVASRFQQWATSAEGQNSISIFVARAVNDLHALWNMVTAFGGLLSKILFSPEAMNAGATIFNSMAGTFRNMIAGIARAQADGSFKRWFSDAIKFGASLWHVIEALYGTFVALYNSGVLNGITYFLNVMAAAIKQLNKFIGPLVDLMAGPLVLAFSALTAPLAMLTGALGWVSSAFDNTNAHAQNSLQGILGAAAAAGAAIANMPQAIIPGQTLISNSSLGTVQHLGQTAIDATNIPKVKTPKTYHNPYTAWANSLIKNGPAVRIQMMQAMKDLNKQAVRGVKDATTAADGKTVIDAMNSLVDTLSKGADDMVNRARDALNSAATTLANASSAKAAKAALKAVNQARQDMQDAIDNRTRLKFADNILNKQKITRIWNIDDLLRGQIRSNTTLAEFAQARFLIANRLTAAKQKLTDALSLRDNYKKQIEDATKSFGDLTTAQAQTLDGVAQALTSTDIVTNLQTRLDQIKKFQTDLKLLLAQGLSNDAYKSIVDQGVQAGTPFADALLAGGTGAIQQTNALVSQINGMASQLGADTSNRLYQAGVDAAQGLVDGLTSLSKQLDSAAAKLGDAVAAAIKRQLGIHSPSLVAYGLMYDGVGDGLVGGLDAAHGKVGNAAARLAGQVAVSPEVAAYAASQSQTPSVSGNEGRKFRDLIVNTPTEDPRAVAMETLNEVTGRL